MTDESVKRLYDHGIAIAAAGAAWGQDFMTTADLDREISARLRAIVLDVMQVVAPGLAISSCS